MAQDNILNTPKLFYRNVNMGIPTTMPRPTPNLPSLHTSSFKPRRQPIPSLSPENKVIVYGFSTFREKEAVLSRFRGLGTVESVEDRGGNWFSISYSSKAEAQKALSMDGQIIIDQLMIGVKPSFADEMTSYDFRFENATVFQTEYRVSATPRRLLSFWDNLRLYLFNLD